MTLVDLGTGSADLPLAAVAWARRAGFDLRVTALDIHETTLELARDHVARHPKLADAVELRRCDALEAMEELGANSFDYAHAGMFLHHLSEIEVLTALRVMERLASKGIVWNDLLRTRLAMAGIWVLTIGQGEMVKHDARVSVRAGFTRREVLEFASRLSMGYAGFESSVLTQRFTLAGEFPGAWT